MSVAKFAVVVGLFGLLQTQQVAAGNLHAFCWGAGSCADNGTNTPTGQNPPQFGFYYASGPLTGNYILELLVPNSIAPVASYSFTETQGGSNNTDPATLVTGNLFSTTAWTTGQLDAYLGMSASPANPIGAYLPSAQAFEPTASGFYVYQFSLGLTQLHPNADKLDGPLFSANSPLVPGSYVVGFVQTGATKAKKKSPSVPTYDGTPNSAALLSTGIAAVPGPIAGAGLPGLAVACYGLIALWRRRKTAIASRDHTPT